MIDCFLFPITFEGPTPIVRNWTVGYIYQWHIVVFPVAYRWYTDIHEPSDLLRKS